MRRPPGGRFGLPAALVAVALTAGAVDHEPDPPSKAWRDGTARYLLTEVEYVRYGRLKTPEARAAFVKRFWRRLDPDPASPENEFRTVYERRCREAGWRFREGLTPGWRTDRGKVFVLVGEPDGVRRDAGDALGRDREIWTYASGSNAAPTEVFFRRDAQGRFRLALGPEDWAGRQAAELSARQLMQQLRWMDRRLPAPATRQLAQALTRPSSAPIFPPTSRPAAAGPRPVESPPLSAGIQDAGYFFQARDGSVLAMLVLGVRAEEDREDHHVPGPAGDTGPTEGPPPPPPSATAWVWDSGRGPYPESGGASFRVDLEPGAADGADSDRARILFTGRVYLEPGEYEIRYALSDPADRNLSVRTGTLRVPELGSGGLSASSVVPAERFGPLRPGSVSPFAVGSEEVVPRPGGCFHRGEPLRLYFQVYGATPEPVTGKSRVDVQFTFERLLRGRYRRHGKPLTVRGAQGASMGLALPIGDWPAGDYRVGVDLHDRISGARASTESDFRILDQVD